MKAKAVMKKVFRWFLVALATLNTLFLFGMRPVWTGISKVLGYGAGKSQFIYDLPMYLCILFFVFIPLCVWNAISKKEKHPFTVALFILEAVFTGVLVYIVLQGALDYMTFILRDFIKSLCVVLLLLVLAFFLFLYPYVTVAYKKVFKPTIMILACAAAVVFLCRFGINRITYEPVVYAVEDEYQIVFSSSMNSVGSVIVNGTEFYDTTAGSEMSFTKVHKVCVPMKLLDRIGSYTISVEHPVYRGPFGAIRGKEIKKEYRFIPADTSNGINYFCLSDVHEHVKQSTETAMHDKDMDFLVICGDTASYVPDPVDANRVNKLAFEITQGAKPVIYARGNHETKGKTAEELYKYVGSKDGSYYYTFALGDIYGIVLDIGEDHDDDWWEYSGMARYDAYRQEQLDFLDEIISEGDYAGYKYRLAVCHIPPVFVNSRHNHEYCKAEMTKRLNELDIDMLVTGHQHDIYIFEPGLVKANEPLAYNPAYKDGTYNGYLTDFNFPCLMISKTGYTQKDGSELYGATSQIGLKIVVDNDCKTQRCVYYTSNGLKVSTVNQFAEKEYGDEIVVTKQSDGSFTME